MSVARARPRAERLCYGFDSETVVDLTARKKLELSNSVDQTFGLSDSSTACPGDPMQLVHIYLNFPGTTREAFQFYETVFKTKIAMIQTFGETSFMPNVPDAAKPKIMHAQLPITQAVHLMASDVVEGFSPPVTFGNNFQISLVADDKVEADRVFAALSAGGRVSMPMANAPWGPYFGMCADRFGVQWMVSLPHPV
jgi:PhnB protein